MTRYCCPRMDREVSLCNGANASNVPALRKPLRLPPEAERPGVSEAEAARYASVTAGESVAGSGTSGTVSPPREDRPSPQVRFCRRLD